MRTVGKLTPEYFIKDNTKTEKSKRKIISVESRQSSTDALPAAKIRETPRAIFPRHIFADSVPDSSPPAKTGITREQKIPLVLNRQATTLKEEFDPFKL